MAADTGAPIIGHNQGPPLDEQAPPIMDVARSERRKHEFVWDGRGERGEDARIAVLAGRAPSDLRLTCVHLRILGHLGRFNNKKGWCRLSQTDLATMFGVRRQAINKAIGELVEWGYIERRSQVEVRESFCLYRTIIDPPEGAGVSATPDTPPGEEVSATPDTSVRSRRTGVSPRKDTQDHHVDHVDYLPPTPRKRGAKRGRENSLETIIDDLKAAGQPAHVLDGFIAPVVRALKLDKELDSPRGLFEETCRLLAHYPSQVLELAACQMILDRKVWCSVKDVAEPIRRAAPMAKQWRITPDMAEHWAAWKAYHLAEKGLGQGVWWVRYCEGTGYFPQLTEWPPGHGQGQRSAAEVAA